MVLIVNYNNFQKAKFLNASNSITGNIFESYSSVYNFFHLKAINEQLSKDNATLRKRIQDLLLSDIKLDSKRISNLGLDYQFIPARVINNSVNKQYNYITLNKGSADGIEQDMGVIGPDGVVGVITNVSEHFCTGQSVLNKRWSVSGKIKDYFGSLVWDGKDYRYAQLKEIPFHVELEIGDRVTTSSYSSVFPEGILIGKVSDIKHKSGDNFYDITVELSSDLKAISYVEVVYNIYKKEKEELEGLNKDD